MIQNLVRNQAGDGTPYKLAITRRIPLCNKETVEYRVVSFPEKKTVIMGAVALNCFLESVINHLLDRQAAGTVVFSNSSIYAYPPHQVASRLLCLLAS